MAVRQVVQFVLLPKKFSAVDFYRKGLYHIQLSIYNEDSSNNRKYGCPLMLQSRSADLSQQKKARTDMEKSSYTSEHFQIKYCEQQIHLRTVCVFTLEYQINQRYKTVLQIGLNKLDQVKNIPKQVDNIVPQEKQVQKTKSKVQSTCAQETLNKRNYTRIQTRKVYLNKNLTLNTFKRLYFTNSMCFSYLDFHLSCFHNGFFIRKHQYHRSQFWAFQNSKKQQLFVQDKLYVPNQYKVGKKIRKIFGVQEVQNFYKSTAQKSLKQYQRIVQLYKMYFCKICSGNPRQKVSLKELPNLSYVLIPQLQRQTFKLLKFYNATLQNELFFYILQQSYQIIKNVKYVIQLFIQLLLTMSQNTFQTLIKQQIIKQKRKRLNKLIKNDYAPLQKMKHIKKSYVLKREYYIRSCPLVQDRDLHHPLLVLQNYNWQQFQLPFNSKWTQSLVILIHGFHGSPVDMDKYKNYIETMNKKVHFFTPKSLTQDVNGTIFSLGQKVAQQIRTHIDKSINFYSKISFIGFSLGGVVARAAMHLLEQYKDFFNLFITLGSPHLGVTNLENSFVTAGIWYMRKFQNAQNLEQLAMLQNEEQETILSQLAKSQSLTWPRKFVTVSCKQDHFVPQYSAKIQQNHQNRHISQLSSKIHSRIKRIERVNVWFDVQHITSPFEKIIGRRSHIQFLDNDRFLETLIQLYGSQL